MVHVGYHKIQIAHTWFAGSSITSTVIPRSRRVALFQRRGETDRIVQPRWRVGTHVQGPQNGPSCQCGNRPFKTCYTLTKRSICAICSKQAFGNRIFSREGSQPLIHESCAINVPAPLVSIPPASPTKPDEIALKSRRYKSHFCVMIVGCLSPHPLN